MSIPSMISCDHWKNGNHELYYESYFETFTYNDDIVFDADILITFVEDNRLGLTENLINEIKVFICDIYDDGGMYDAIEERNLGYKEITNPNFYNKYWKRLLREARKAVATRK